MWKAVVEIHPGICHDHLKDSRDIRTQIGEPFEVTPEYPDSNENSLDLTN